MMRAEEIIARWDWLKSVRSPYERTFDEVFRLFFPYSGDLLTRRPPGSNHIHGVFDSTGMTEAEKLASFLKGVIVPSSADWIRFSVGGEWDDNLQVRELLDQMAYKVMRRLHRSNFYVEAGPFLRDLSIVGNAVMSVQPRAPTMRSPQWEIIFENVPLGRMWWQVGPDGTPNIIYREFKMRAMDAHRFFQGNPGPDTLAKISSGGMMEEVAHLLCVYENENSVPGALRAPSEKPWLSSWIALGSNKPEEIAAGGFDTKPLVIGRWHIVNGEPYARGRGNIARVDAKGISELRRQILIAVGRDLSPTLVAEKETDIDIDLGHDGITISRTPYKFQPYFLRPGSDYGAANMVGREDRAQIRAAFMTDSIGEPETETRSAYAERARELRAIRRFAAPTEIVDKQFLTPVTEAVVEIEYRNGQMPEIDEIGRITGAREIDIHFVSPFFTAQKQGSLQRVDELLAVRFERARVSGDQRWLDDIHPGRVAALERKLKDVPASIYATDEELAEIRGARAQKNQVDRVMSVMSQLQGRGGGSAPRSPAPAPAASPDALVGAEVAE